jgi:hypothetical protein
MRQPLAMLKEGAIRFDLLCSAVVALLLPGLQVVLNAFESCRVNTLHDGAQVQQPDCVRR